VPFGLFITIHQVMKSRNTLFALYFICIKLLISHVGLSLL